MKAGMLTHLDAFIYCFAIYNPKISCSGQAAQSRTSDTNIIVDYRME
jgi:hypothetical protein